MASISNITKHIPAVTIYVAPLLAFLGLSAVLNMTTPLESGPLVILVVFVLLYVLIASALFALLHLVGAVIRMLKPGRVLSLRRAYYMASIIALAPVLFVALNTLGQLDVLEIVLILILVGLGCFYVLRRSAK